MEEMQIQKQIGEGSFGKVYLAKWKETTVAVKILTNTSGSSDDDFPTRLPNPLLQSLEKVCHMGTLASSCVCHCLAGGPHVKSWRL
jgi:serine/threonine protein kinase